MIKGMNKSYKIYSNLIQKLKSTSTNNIDDALKKLKALHENKVREQKQKNKEKEKEKEKEVKLSTRSNRSKASRTKQNSSDSRVNKEPNKNTLEDAARKMIAEQVLPRGTRIKAKFEDDAVWYYGKVVKVGHNKGVLGWWIHYDQDKIEAFESCFYQASDTNRHAPSYDSSHFRICIELDQMILPLFWAAAMAKVKAKQDDQTTHVTTSNSSSSSKDSTPVLPREFAGWQKSLRGKVNTGHYWYTSPDGKVREPSLSAARKHLKTPLPSVASSNKKSVSSVSSVSKNRTESVAPHLKVGTIVMVSYDDGNDSKWGKAKICKHVATGIKIEWVEGKGKQLISTTNVEIDIREMDNGKKDDPNSTSTLSSKRKRDPIGDSVDGVLEPNLKVTRV